MKITYKLAPERFDINPNRIEHTDDTSSAAGIINQFISQEYALSDPQKSKVTIKLKAKGNRKDRPIDEILFNDKVVWHYCNGFTKEWQLFKLEQQIKN